MKDRDENEVRTVLLVDDDGAVRKICSLLLQKFGYAVIEAENGEVAKRVWNEHWNHIDVLVTDVVMPGSVDGFGLALFCHNQRPDLKIIVISGYCTQFFETAIPSWVSFLPKPFTPEALNRQIQDCVVKN